MLMFCSISYALNSRFNCSLPACVIHTHTHTHKLNFAPHFSRAVVNLSVHPVISLFLSQSQHLRENWNFLACLRERKDECEEQRKPVELE